MKNKDSNLPQIYIWRDKRNYLKRKDNLKMRVMKAREEQLYYKAKNKINYKKRTEQRWN